MLLPWPLSKFSSYFPRLFSSPEQCEVARSVVVPGDENHVTAEQQLQRGIANLPRVRRVLARTPAATLVGSTFIKHPLGSFENLGTARWCFVERNWSDLELGTSRGASTRTEETP